MTILQEYKEIIISDYLSGLNTVELGKKYECGAGNIYYFLKKWGINMRSNSEAQRKYALDERYFDNTDTEDKAYILGLLYADGCNSPETNCVRIILTAEDKELLEKISNLIYYEKRPLSLRKGKLFTDDNKTYFRKDSYQFTITNKHISKTLEQHGVVKSKSLILAFPQWIPDRLLSHFIRGYFDGDGSISISSNQINISILGTKDFIKNLQKLLDTMNIKSSTCHAKRGSEIDQISIHGNGVGRKFMNWIYKDASIFLNRKYQKYQDILNIIPAAKAETCSLCSDKHYSSGYCSAHHYQIIGKQLRHERYINTGK